MSLKKQNKPKTMSLNWILFNLPPEVEDVAAIVIQRRWRGFWVRARLARLIEYLQGGPVSSLDPKAIGPRSWSVCSSSHSFTHIDHPEDAFPVEVQANFSQSVSSASYSIISAGSQQLGRFPHAIIEAGEAFSLLLDISETDLRSSSDHAVSKSEDDSSTISEELVARDQGVFGKTRKRHLSVREASLDEPADRTASDSSREVEGPAKRIKRRMTKKTAARLALEASYDRYVQQALKQGRTSAEMMQFPEYCTHRIQIWWLMKHRRFLRARFIQRLIELKNKSMAMASMMEVMIREQEKTKKKKRDGPLTEREAAISIQRAWRRHIDIQVYRYYRDLINFKTRGDPSVMLRCINPNEAKLLDPASGTSVRFRLAGDRFPPNIYYKIFTHRPVQDMCANSPKDYTRPEAKQLNVRHRHNKVARLPPQDDPSKEHWYKRFENNGWRLVSDRLIHHIMNDPITWESSKKTYQFDHSKLKRKQDVEKQKKSRKIEWMQKMYKEGMLRARADDQETVQLIEGAAAGMIATVENQGPEALEDWEVDELLDWTTSLNFEEYFSTWKDLATSAPAEGKIEKTMNVGTSNADPYELTVSTAPSRFQSTCQSRHTPATLTSGSIHVKT